MGLDGIDRKSHPGSGTPCCGVPATRSARCGFAFSFAAKATCRSKGPCCLVSNHQSNLDPVLVGVACPRQLKYLARQGLFFWPFSLWIRSLGAVPIDRERGALSGIRTTLELLKQQNAVLVFPEGSRTDERQTGCDAAGLLLAGAAKRGDDCARGNRRRIRSIAPRRSLCRGRTRFVSRSGRRSRSSKPPSLAMSN